MNDLNTALLGLLARKDYLPSTAPELLRQLHLTAARRGDLDTVLEALERSGQLARIKGDRYIAPQEADLIPGRIRMNRSGKGFLQPDEPGLKEIVIPENATGTALHEDRVLVRRDVRSKGLRTGAADAMTGSVVRILERRRMQIVGTLQRGPRFCYVIPDDPRIPHDIYVPEPKDVGRRANVGDKVVVELREWQSRQMSPEGEVIEVLGPPDAEGVDMLSILRQYDLPLHFPKAVLQEAHAIGNTVQERDLAGRVDCRKHRVITIDPDDAKDFDDAIYLERVSADQWRLWVHIADVSHYVRPGTALDLEARKRGNSTYLVDRVIPMLPEALSNELCSLKPKVDRLTKCVEFLLANDGRVLNTKFYPAIIHSQQRFTYREVLALLQRKPSSDPIEQMVHQAHELAQKIRKARFKAGSLELDFPEMKIRLDEAGRVARIEKIENDISHQLIEEYMLLANEAVAGRLMQVQKPTVYRVHEAPEESRLQEYREEVLSHNVPCGNLRQRTEIQRLLHKLNTLPIGPALKIGFLKSLMRARYALEPLGHFGLAKKKYAHFTSPIRRYADLVVHRSLFEAHPISASALLPIAEHISITERTSADAERDSKDVKRFAYLKAQLTSGNPAVYPALVTEVRNFGFFVDVPDLAMSGVVPLSTVEDDFFVYDAARNHLLGRRTRRIIRLGDPVNVQVAKVDTFKKQVDFRLAGKLTPKGKGHPTPASRTGRPEATQRPSRPAPGRNGPPGGPKLHPAGRPSAKPHSNQPASGQHRGAPHHRRDGAATAPVDRPKAHRAGPEPRGGKPAPTPAKPAPHSGKPQRPGRPHPQHSRAGGSTNRPGQPPRPSNAPAGRPNAPQKPPAPRPTSTTASSRPVIPTRQAIIPTQRTTALTGSRPIIPSSLGRSTPTRTWRRE